MATPQEESEIVVGLDIGTTKICAVVGRRTEFGKIEVLGVGRADSLGVNRGVVVNIDKTVESIRKAIDEASERSNVDIEVVCVGIAGQHIQSLQHKGMLVRDSSEDEINERDVRALIDSMYKLVMRPGYEILHVLPQEYNVDDQQNIKDPIGMSGVRLEASFHVITGQVTAANNVYRCVRRAGLKVSDLILEPLASSEAVLSEEEKEAGVVLIDIGGGTTDLAIFQEGIIRHTAVIPYGGNVITEDIKEGCLVMRNQAELLKIRFGSAMSSETSDNEIVAIPGLRGREPKEIKVRNLANIIQARMEEIIDHIIYEINASSYSKRLIAGIVLTGGGAQLKNLRQLMERATGRDVRIGLPNEHLAPSRDARDRDGIELHSPIYATGIGLVIAGLQDNTALAMSTKSTTTGMGSPALHEANGHATAASSARPQKGRWFEQFLKKGREFFEDKDFEDPKL